MLKKQTNEIVLLHCIVLYYVILHSIIGIVLSFWEAVLRKALPSDINFIPTTETEFSSVLVRDAIANGRSYQIIILLSLNNDSHDTSPCNTLQDIFS